MNKIIFSKMKILTINAGSSSMKFSIIELKKKGFTDANITVSHERKMCCGLGKCGHCRVNDHYICLDGPVFSYEVAKDFVD